MNAPFKPVDEAATSFARRHIGPDQKEIASMLGTLGFESIDALIDQAVPPQIRLRKPLDLPEAKSESQALAEGTYGHDGVFHAKGLQAKCASKYAPADDKATTTPSKPAAAPGPRAAGPPSSQVSGSAQ